MVRITILLLIISAALASCGTPRDFHQRRYLPGRYADKKDDRTNTTEASRKTEMQNTATANNTQKQSPAVTAAPAEENKTASANTGTHCAPGKKHAVRHTLPDRYNIRKAEKKFLSPVNRKFSRQHTPGAAPFFGGSLLSLILVLLFIGSVYLITQGYVTAGVALAAVLTLLIILLALIVVMVISRIINDSFEVCNQGCR